MAVAVREQEVANLKSLYMAGNVSLSELTAAELELLRQCEQLLMRERELAGAQ